MFTLTSSDAMTVQLGGAATTTNPAFVASFYDTTIAGGLTSEGITKTSTSGATPVTVMGSPAASTFRHLRGFLLNNIDSAAVTVSITVGAVVFKATLNVGDALQFNEKGGQGFIVVDTNGQFKQTIVQSTASAATPAASTYGGAATVGVSVVPSRDDHKHALAALPTATTGAAGIIQISTSVGTTDGVAAAGATGQASDAGHVHPATTDATIATTNVTTNNASTTKHGFEPQSVAPAANQLNVVGIANAETVTSMKTILGATAAAPCTPLALSAAGVALDASHRDHGHQTPGGIQSITAAASVGPSVGTEVTIATVTLPTNFLFAGTSFRFKFQGTLQLQATSGTLTLKMYVGANAGQTVQLASQGSLVAQSYCEFEGLATVRSTGASGTFIATGALYTLTSATAVLQCMQGGASTTVVDTTAATPVVKLTAQFATSSTTNILIAQNATIEIVKM